jgi:tetratricopeptide (TPR) repeat protein
VRVNGWKAIAAHFRRNRSTVMRWAEAGDFPVRRVSGRSSGSVWAYAHELDAWLAKGPPEKDTAQHGQRVEPARPSIRRSGIILAGLAVLVVAAITTLIVLRPQGSLSPPARALPADPAVANIYLQARDDWSGRTPAGLHKSVAEFGEVTSRDPGFAPGYAGLADAYILAREFDGVPDAVAFSKATAAAKAALAIDPNSADANRALGFIDYWGRRDLRAAREHFRQSLRISPNDAQTHFWFGNILMFVGASAEGLRELRSARLLDPGSTAIQTDYAWALWWEGPGDPGLAELEDLAARSPPLATPHRFLTFIFLARGDVAQYLDESETWAALQNNPALTARVAGERDAFRSGGARAVLEAIARQPPGARVMEGTATEWPATAASLAGDRAQLLRVLARGDAAGDHWNSWRRDQARYTKWLGDPVVRDKLDRLGARPPGGAVGG